MQKGSGVIKGRFAKAHSYPNLPLQGAGQAPCVHMERFALLHD